MNWHSLILFGLIVLFAIAAATPIHLVDAPITITKLEKWQTWYGAILGFGGLIAVAYYNGAVDRAREEDRHKRQKKALVTTVAWEVFGLAHRSHWAHSALKHLVEDARKAAEKSGWVQDGPDDAWINATGHQILYTYVPETVALKELVSQLGHLGGVAPQVASYASLVTQARLVLNTAFEVNDQGHLSLRNLITTLDWLQDISEEGISLLGELANEFDELAEQIQGLQSRVEIIDQNMPEALGTLTVDSSNWTG